MDGWREPAGRSRHSTAVVDNQLYLWGGYQDGMPQVHDSAEKRQFYSSVEVFDVNTGCWEQRTTRGTPPLGVYGYSCVAVRNELHYFGGYCGHSRMLPQQCSHTEHLHPAMEDVGPLNNRGWGTNAEAILWNGALHLWRGGPLVCGGRVWSCCPIITTTWSTVSTSILVVVCVPMNNTFSLCPQVSDTVLSQYSPPSSE